MVPNMWIIEIPPIIHKLPGHFNHCCNDHHIEFSLQNVVYFIMIPYDSYPGNGINICRSIMAHERTPGMDNAIVMSHGLGEML